MRSPARTSGSDSPTRSAVVDAGTVGASCAPWIGTSPAAGTSVSRGAKVTINVSKGPDLVVVPDVTGKSVPDATTIMQQAGLSIGNVFGPPNKKVFVSDPPAGTHLHRGSSVNVYTK